MKLHTFLLVLLPLLGCSGFPLHNSDLASMADRALGAAMAQVNSIYAVSHLYGATQGSVKKVSLTSLNTVDLLMTFEIKETECVKTSMRNPQTCAFKQGFFMPSFPCSSQVRVSSTSTQVVSLRCGHDASVSSESSEEMFSRGRHQINAPPANRGLVHSAPPPPPPPPPPIQPEPSKDREVQLRGDTFSNYLE
ncbi:secreted phosphoprotein 24 [Antennarius striatus]|uniref:secreted phosphoprotein 24 n=1 Tax=Antennarius striatus TaxID=241820 RepID=UPI0035B324B3